MRHILPTIVSLLSLPLTSLPAQAQMVTISPAQIAEIFCIGSLGNDMAPVEALLTPQLTETIAHASDVNREFEAAHPGDKPPLGDGLPWRTWPDYADGCTVGEARIEPSSASVDINYSFAAQPDANYTNTLQLMAVDADDGLPAVWRIDDVDLGDGQTLRSLLVAMFED
jgi:hypothetical protein